MSRASSAIVATFPTYSADPIQQNVYDWDIERLIGVAEVTLDVAEVVAAVLNKPDCLPAAIERDTGSVGRPEITP